MDAENLQEAAYLQRLIRFNENFKNRIREDMETVGRCKFLLEAMADAEADGRRYEKAYKEIVDSVEKVQPEQLRQLLKLYYLEGLNLHGVAGEMGYSYQHVKRLHGKALKAFEEV